jgi:enoyl-CoA hydratase/carnithine racemase
MAAREQPLHLPRGIAPVSLSENVEAGEWQLFNRCRIAHCLIVYYETVSEYTTIEAESADRVLTVTLNRPHRLNAFDEAMCREFEELWRAAAFDDEVRAVVLRAAGDRAFSTGVDVSDPMFQPSNAWSHRDPGARLGPKANLCWKPVVCAVHGMAAGGAFYWISESDIVICSEDATFFEPHVSYGMTAALEPIGLLSRIPLGDVLRMALMGLDERISPARALQIGLVTEVVERDELWSRADELARSIAAKSPVAVQGTIRAIWEALDVGRKAALDRGLHYTILGNYLETGDPLGLDNPNRPPKVKDWRLR